MFELTRRLFIFVLVQQYHQQYNKFCVETLKVYFTWTVSTVYYVNYISYKYQNTENSKIHYISKPGCVFCFR
jgi:hypothetical protein